MHCHPERPERSEGSRRTCFCFSCRVPQVPRIWGPGNDNVLHPRCVLYQGAVSTRQPHPQVFRNQPARRSSAQIPCTQKILDTPLCWLSQFSHFENWDIQRSGFSIPYSLVLLFPPAKNRAIISAIRSQFAVSRAISFRPIGVST